MIVTISPASISGAIKAPPSKSCTQRICAAALLSCGITHLANVGNSNDELAALSIIEQLGATVTYYGNSSVSIKSDGIKPSTTQIDCGESGLAVRMFASIAALSNETLTLTGTGSLMNRPMHFFEEVFPQLGVEVKSNNGKLPIAIQGKLKPADIEIDGFLSSQFLSGLLFAYSASEITKPVTITVKNLNSKPYIDLTLQIMQRFNLNVPQNSNYNFTFTPQYSLFPQDAEHNIHNSTFNIEGDWSSAAFLLAAGAIAGDVCVTGLNLHSYQADRAILQVLQNCGCNIVVSNDRIHVKSAPLKAFEFDATDCPDLFPPLVALAAYCQGTSIIKGVHRLLHKESNRANTLQEAFAKLGVSIAMRDDAMTIEGGNTMKGGTVQSHNDHRIAMACAVAALRADSEVVIEDAEAVNKSYPKFFDDLSSLTRADAH